MIEAIAQQIREARMADRPILHLRVTPDAIPGTVTTTPLAPGRLRRYRALAAEEGTILPDLSSNVLEIVVAPVDWDALLVEKDAFERYAVEVDPGSGVKKVLGVRVVQE